LTAIRWEPRFEVLYLLHSIARNIRLKMKVACPAPDPVVATVTPVWKRQLVSNGKRSDLFGVAV